MANHKSAKKRIRQTAKKNFNNKVMKTSARKCIKKVRDDISQKDKAAAQKSFILAQSSLSLLAKKGVVHANTSSRLVSRLSSQVSAL